MHRSIVDIRTFVLIAVVAARLGAQGGEPESKVEQEARLARRGAGLSAGTWTMAGVSSPSGATVSDLPMFEGFFRKGLDQHLALETSVGFWRRTLDVPSSGGLGGSSASKASVYLIPQFTGLKLYPLTKAADSFEPFLSGAVGFTIGVQDISGSGGLFGGGGGQGLIAGLGGSAGAGVEWRMGSTFGLVVGGHYSYVQFFDDLAGNRIYKGPGVRAGITYRFTY